MINHLLIMKQDFRTHSCSNCSTYGVIWQIKHSHTSTAKACSSRTGVCLPELFVPLSELGFLMFLVWISNQWFSPDTCHLSHLSIPHLLNTGWVNMQFGFAAESRPFATAFCVNDFTARGNDVMYFCCPLIWFGAVIHYSWEQLLISHGLCQFPWQ